MNFTKEYIKECDCKEIQGLRKEFEIGDWYYFGKSYPTLFDLETSEQRPNKNYKSDIWLPTGDQLDDEIVKICKKENLEYEFKYHYNIDKGIWQFIVSIDDISEWFICKNNTNPLVAKIEALKAFLKSETEEDELTQTEVVNISINEKGNGLVIRKDN